MNIDYKDYKQLFEEAEKKLKIAEQIISKRDGSEKVIVIDEETKVETIRDISKLRANISRIGCLYGNIISQLYKDYPSNEIIKIASHLTLIGIICSVVFDTPAMQRIYEELRPNDDEIFKSQDAWESINQSSRDFIMRWIQKFHHLPSTQPEALISMNLWYLVLRGVVISMETNTITGICLECGPEFKTTSVKAMGANFVTDLVFLAGRSGLPLFMVEMAAAHSKKFPSVHKDFKKLAVQMGGVLFQLIGSIRTRGDETACNFVPSLRVFGALIYGTKIQFCISHAKIGTKGEFFIVFETHPLQWTFDLYHDKVIHPDITIPSFSPNTLDGSAKLVEAETTDLDVPVPLILQVYTPLSQSLGSNDSSVEETEAKTGEDHPNPTSESEK